MRRRDTFNPHQICSLIFIVLDSFSARVGFTLVTGVDKKSSPIIKLFILLENGKVILVLVTCTWNAIMRLVFAINKVTFKTMGMTQVLTGAVELTIGKKNFQNSTRMERKYESSQSFRCSL